MLFFYLWETFCIFLESKLQLILFSFSLVFFLLFDFLFFFFWNETAFNCVLEQCAWICWHTIGTLWSLSCHWHLLMKPISISISSQLQADPHLPMPHGHFKSPFCSPFYIVHLGSKLVGWTLGLVSVGCQSSMKAVWRQQHHAALISAYLCIHRASYAYAWLHGCGYSSL